MVTKFFSSGATLPHPFTELQPAGNLSASYLAFNRSLVLPVWMKDFYELCSYNIFSLCINFPK